MVFDYCPRCGNKLDTKEIGDEGFVPFCKLCNNVYFNFSYPCVLCIVIDESENVVLTKRRINSNYGLVAGFVKENETIENTAQREVEEEIGLTAYEINYIKSYYYEKDDRLMLGFICKVKNTYFKISNELYSADWYPIIKTPTLLRQGSISQQLVLDYLQNN